MVQTIKSYHTEEMGEQGLSVEWCGRGADIPLHTVPNREPNMKNCAKNASYCSHCNIKLSSDSASDQHEFFHNNFFQLSSFCPWVKNSHAGYMSASKEKFLCVINGACVLAVIFDCYLPPINVYQPTWIMY